MMGRENDVPRFRIAALLGLAATVTGNAPAKAPLAGTWGGPGAMLTLDAQGGKLAQDCGGGRFGPVKADARGKFKAAGQFETYRPGPQRADEPGEAGAPAATYEGTIAGDTIRLTIRPAAGPAQTLTLVKGKRVKLIRCY